MHTGDRSADAIDVGGVLPGYRAVIVRDGSFGYGHLTDALHAWCGAHLLRDLKDLYDFEPGRQDWASQMAALLLEARGAARDARQAGKTALDAGVLENLVSRYQALATSGLAANTYRRTATAKDARRIARRFLNFEDMILRFATRPDLDIFTNNEAERTIRPVKVQQRSSGGAWRTIDRTPGDGVGGDGIGQPGDVAALIILQVQVGRKIDVDHLIALVTRNLRMVLAAGACGRSTRRR
jgi:transposase